MRPISHAACGTHVSSLPGLNRQSIIFIKRLLAKKMDQPESGLPDLGHLKMRKSDKSDLRWSSPRVTKVSFGAVGPNMQLNLIRHIALIALAAFASPAHAQQAPKGQPPPNSVAIEQTAM